MLVENPCLCLVVNDALLNCHDQMACSCVGFLVFKQAVLC